MDYVEWLKKKLDDCLDLPMLADNPKTGETQPNKEASRELDKIQWIG